MYVNTVIIIIIVVVVVTVRHTLFLNYWTIVFLFVNVTHYTCRYYKEEADADFQPHLPH